MSNRVEPVALLSSGSCPRIASSAKNRSVGLSSPRPDPNPGRSACAPASRVATNGYTSTEVIPAPMSDAPTAPRCHHAPWPIPTMATISGRPVAPKSTRLAVLRAPSRRSAAASGRTGRRWRRIEHRRREAERVADRDQVQRDLRRVERLADRRQRDVRRSSQVRDRRDEDQRDEDDARAVRRDSRRPPLGRSRPGSFRRFYQMGGRAALRIGLRAPVRREPETEARNGRDRPCRVHDRVVPGQPVHGRDRARTREARRVEHDPDHRPGVREQGRGRHRRSIRAQRHRRGGPARPRGARPRSDRPCSARRT